MSNANPLVVVFSQSLAHQSAHERANAVSSVLLYLNREGVHAFSRAGLPRDLRQELKPFLCPEFYQAGCPKGRVHHREEALISLGYQGLQKLDYLLSGHIITVALSDEQRGVIEEFGFQTQAAASPTKPLFQKIQLRRREFDPSTGIPGPTCYPGT